MKKKLYLQLHEQYAINNNANLSTIMTLVVSLVVVIGYYGYIFVNTSNKYRVGELFYDKEAGTYYLDVLLLVYCASILVLGILFCVCTYQGIAQRKEQFIIDAIRKKCEVDEDKILPEGYKPHDKNGLEVIQGLYGELIKIFFGVAVILTLLTCCRCIGCTQNNMILVNFIIPLIIIIAVLVYCILYYRKQQEKYKKRQDEFPKERKDQKKGKRCIETYERRIEEYE